MLSSPNINKYANFLEQITPQKINVQRDINSWLQTHIKNQVVYKYRNNRKYLKEDNALIPPKYTNKKAGLAQLKAYKQNLLKSSIKKISERFQPKHQDSSNISPQQAIPKIKDISLQVKSLGRAYQRPKYQPIVITEFQPNVEEREQQKEKQGKLNLYLQIQFQNQNKIKRAGPKATGNKTISVSLYRPRRLSTRNSSRMNQSKSQASIPFPSKILNPQQNGVSLVSRRLLSKKI